MEKTWVDKYEQILENLFKQYQQKLAGQKIGILVSGGIDSSIIAYFVNRYFSDCYLISLQSEKSVDDDFVVILAKHLKKNSLLVRVTKEDLVSIQPKIENQLKQAKVDINPMQLALASIYYYLFKQANQLEIRTIFTGQGPDILLAGYSKYRQLSGKTLKQAIQNDLPLLSIDKARDGAMAQFWRINALNPYLEKSVMNFCLSVPTALLIYQGQEKYLSRALGKKLGLPKEIVNRPKKAMQYSTGVAKILK